jgi:aminoglycoside phosphotransferase (APT) family kinase protein
MAEPGRTESAGRLPDLASNAQARARLELFIAANVAPEAGPRLISTKRLSGGFSNETWLLHLAANSAYGFPLHLILRRSPLAGPLEPYDLNKEAAVLRLAASRVRVPHLYAYCADDSVVGSPFLIMQYVEGAVPDYRDLPKRNQWDSQEMRIEMGWEFMRTLSAIQAVRWRGGALEAAFRSRPNTHPDGAALSRIEQQIQDKVGGRWPIPPVVADSSVWLHANLPALAADDLVLVHGDYKVGNLIWDGTKIVSVIDWELAGIGDPLHDLGYACHPIMRMRDPSLMAMLLTMEELQAAYREHFGRALDLPRLHYYAIYGLFFHLYTAIMGINAVMYSAGDFRMSSMYSKLSEASAFLVREIARYEDGDHAF